MPLQTASIRAALLAAGQDLELSRALIDPTVSPVGLTEGYEVAGAAVGRVLIGMRRASPGRVVDVRVTTFDASATYTATIAGTSIAATGGPWADVEALVTQWAADITANATVGTGGANVYQCTAAPVDSTGGGTVDTVRITGGTPESWSFVATDSGTAALSVTLDPETATIQIYEQVSTSGIPTLATRIPDADDLSTLTGWALMQGAAGDAVVAVTDGIGREYAINVQGVTRVRPYVSVAAAGVAGDAATAGSVAVTVRDPVVAVVFGRVAG